MGSQAGEQTASAAPCLYQRLQLGLLRGVWRARKRAVGCQDAPRTPGRRISKLLDECALAATDLSQGAPRSRRVLGCHNLFAPRVLRS